MVDRVRRIVLFMGAGLIIATQAVADYGRPANSTIPAGIILMGQTSGITDVRGEFTITVRGIANQPIRGSVVLIDFTGCADAAICPTQPFASVTADCSSHPGTVTVVANDAGQATFRIMGGRNVASAGAGDGFKCAMIYADGIHLGSVTVAVADENGSGTNSGTACNVADFSLALSDALHGLQVGRSDFNLSGKVDVADLSLLLGILMAGGSATGCASDFCH